MSYKESKTNFEPINIPEITESLRTGAAVMDDDKKTWDSLTEQLISSSSRIIALRGAGSWNGMDKSEADELIKEKLIPEIEKALLKKGTIVIMHDGDYDDPQKPDIGYIVGRLLDHFGNGDRRVVFLVAQKESWHPDELAGRNLSNAKGVQYVTYLFPNDSYPDDHSSFTQSSEFVDSEKYEQWYIGASGKIAESQLHDYSQKVKDGEKRKAVIFRVKNNQSMSEELDAKLEKAIAENDEKKIANLQGRLEQRKQLYGVHWDNEGNSTIDPEVFPGLEFEFVS